MSIYVSAVAFDADDHDGTCKRWVPIKAGDPDPARVMYSNAGRFRYDGKRRCTCNAGPFVYRASHLLPSDKSARGGSFSLCEIPGFISRGDRVLCENEETCPQPQCCDRVWPHLRVWVIDGLAGSSERGAVVLVDRAQVAEVHAYLGRWLERAA